MSWPAALIWLLIGAAALSRGPGLLYLTSVLVVFGTLQMMPGDGGGANMLPQSACAAVLILKVLGQRGNLYRALDVATDPKRLGLLTGYTVYALLTAMALPRLFAGQIEIVPVSGYVSGTGILQASFGNITQCFYLLLSFGTALSFAVLGRRPELQRQYRRALVATGVAIVATGLVDLVCYRLGLTSLLDPFRTATYALLTDAEAEGAKRVVGLMPEASGYGSMCVTILAALTFLRPHFSTPQRRAAVLVLVLALLVMAALSTSSTAYVGLAVFVPIYAAHIALRLRTAEATAWADTRSEIILIVLIVFALFAAMVFEPDVFDPVRDMLDKIVFQKASTASYVERSMWTRVGMQAVVDTAGLGVGIGSLRTSNWFVSILGSTGLFGSLLIFGFMAYVFLGRIPGGEPGRFAQALRLSLIPSLLMVGISGTIPDIGIGVASVYGILGGIFGGPTGVQPARAPAQGSGAWDQARPLGAR